MHGTRLRLGQHPGGAASSWAPCVSEGRVPVRTQGHKAEIQAMYQEWPFFRSTIDLVEMVRN